MLFQLNEEDFWFPDPLLAEEDGLLAIGGDLKTERLRCAYAQGIFPWYDESTPILWYAPPNRFILLPQDLRISKSMRKELRSNSYRITYNSAFAQVIRHCALTPRKGQQGTWITEDMQTAYINLHQEGFAMSVEVWKKEQLVGGLYGVICGKRNHVFCGESMFSLAPNASKLALIELCTSNRFELIDCQIESEHLRSMGAKVIPAKSYYQLLQT
ncbi:leucyl/phenylalanyl-tRNA--protein transferase [Olivibacter sp. SA151]|uniref:leucyl/phenylalanyl-tRNA--protein transferase n=1 Tax=Olivibacter TaxID=376469 RepID=UPI0025A46042|nr:leucyl/phenylalanyl-tRNA--protein transferase [Olivibacter sp. 47]MDM8177309.1 leucyl/phenylalanyl-tRNA--protein transferase [Olivibacter sp. 47]